MFLITAERALGSEIYVSDDDSGFTTPSLSKTKPQNADAKMEWVLDVLPIILPIISKNIKVLTEYCTAYNKSFDALIKRSVLKDGRKFLSWNCIMIILVWSLAWILTCTWICGSHYNGLYVLDWLGSFIVCKLSLSPFSAPVILRASLHCGLEMFYPIK